MNLDSAMTLFRRLGVDVQSLSRKEFSSAYFALARRYHPDHNANTPDLMANINMARTCIVRSYRWPEMRDAAPGGAANSTRPAADSRTPPPKADQGRAAPQGFGRRVWPSFAQG